MGGDNGGWGSELLGITFNKKLHSQTEQGSCCSVKGLCIAFVTYYSMQRRLGRSLGA